MVEGILSKNSMGRYIINGNEQYELTSGDCIEVEINGIWEPTRIEFSHKTKNYILINGYQINGARVRINF